VEGDIICRFIFRALIDAATEAMDLGRIEADIDAADELDAAPLRDRRDRITANLELAIGAAKALIGGPR
jgi:hypothetical protein